MQTDKQKKNRPHTDRTLQDRPLLLLLLLTAAALVVFFPELKGGFIFDDPHYVTNNPYLDSLKALFNWPDFWTKRPLYWLSFFIEKQIWGNNPLYFKLVSLVVHILTAFFLVKFVDSVCKIKQYKWNHFAVLTGFAFLLSPLTMEAVAYISGRNNTAGGLFFVMGCWLFAAWFDAAEKKGSVRKAIFSLLCFVAATLFKEIYVVFVALVPALYWWLSEAGARKSILLRVAAAYAGVFILGTLAIAYLNVKPLKQIKYGVIQSYRTANFEPLATNTHSILYSMRLFAFPDRLNIDHDLPVLKDFTYPEAWVSALLLILLGALLFFFRRKLPLALPCYLAYLLLILPSNSVLLRHGAWMIDPLSERNLYAPAMFFSILLVHVIFQIARNPKIRRAIVAILLLTLATRTHMRALDFQNDVSLWKSSIKYSPDRPRPYYNLAVALKNAGELEEALPHARKALALSHVSQCYGLLASILKSLNNNQEAESVLLRGTRKLPGQQSILWNQLGQLYYETGRWEKARKAFQTAIDNKPDFIQPKLSLLYIALAESRIAEAGRLLVQVNLQAEQTARSFKAQELLNIDYESMLLFGRGWYKIETGDIANGIAEVKKSVETNPAFIEPYLLLGQHYYRTGDYQESWNWFLRASKQPEFQRYSKQAGPYMRNLPKLLENPDLDPGL